MQFQGMYILEQEENGTFRLQLRGLTLDSIMNLCKNISPQNISDEGENEVEIVESVTIKDTYIRYGILTYRKKGDLAKELIPDSELVVIYKEKSYKGHVDKNVSRINGLSKMMRTIEALEDLDFIVGKTIKLVYKRDERAIVIEI